MSTDKTFSMIKPMAVKKGYIGPILSKITEGGFQIVGMKYTQLSKEQAEDFYGIHKGRPFFESLVTFMSSGPIVALALKKENAVSDFRTLIGATNPAEATEGTIRNMFAETIDANAVHGSDSDENAQIETSFFFSQRELHNVGLIDAKQYTVCEK